MRRAFRPGSRGSAALVCRPERRPGPVSPTPVVVPGVDNRVVEVGGGAARRPASRRVPPRRPTLRPGAGRPSTGTAVRRRWRHRWLLRLGRGARRPDLPGLPHRQRPGPAAARWAAPVAGASGSSLRCAGRTGDADAPGRCTAASSRPTVAKWSAVRCAARPGPGRGRSAALPAIGPAGPYFCRGRPGSAGFAGRRVVVIGSTPPLQQRGRSPAVAAVTTG
jgi:hypothetical protein